MLRRKKIAWLTVSASVAVVSAILLIVSACLTARMVHLYPHPLDLFWSLDLSIDLIVLSAVLLTASRTAIIL